MSASSINKIFLLILCLLFIAISCVTEAKGSIFADIKPGDAELNKVGLYCLQNKKYKKAEQFFKLAIQKNPAVKFYYNNLSTVYMNLKQYDNAYKYLETALVIDPVYVKALCNMAITCFYLHKYIESFKYYKKAAETDKVYVKKRFGRKKTREKIQEIQNSEPDNEELIRILKYSDMILEK